MKKKSMAWILAAAMCVTSFAPVYGAEFTGPVQEEEELFTSGETESLQEDEPVFSAEETPAEYETEESSMPARMELVKEPNLTKYAYKIQTKGISDFRLAGLSFRLLAGDGRVLDTVEMKNNDLFFKGEEGTYEYFWYVRRGDTILEEYDDITPGEYEVFVVLDAPDLETEVKISTKLEVVSPELLIPEVEKKADGEYEGEVQINSEYKTGYMKFTPEKNGHYIMEAECSGGTEGHLTAEDSEGYMIYDQDYSKTCMGTAGQTFYVKYKVEDYKPGMTVRVVLKEAPELVGIEWVQKPEDPLYIGLTVHRDYRLSIRDGKLRLKYSDGSEEIKGIGDFSRYDQEVYARLPLDLDLKNLKPGTYEAKIGVATIGDEFVLPTEVKIKNPDTAAEIPEIRGSGSATVPFGIYSHYVRLRTGAGTEYKINYDIPEDGLNIFITKNEVLKPAHKGRPVTLEPNTIYYISTGGRVEGSYENITFHVTAAKVSLSKCKITASKTAVYTGKNISPSVKVTYNGKTLKKNRDYTVTYSNNKNIGSSARIKITGKGSYTGSKTLSFTITPGKTKIKTAKRSSKGSVSLTWTKAAGASGYLVARSTDGKKWTKAATVKSTSFTDKKAKKKASYQYKVRAYKKVGKKTIYGPYSSVKKVK